jgi:hypothetical protein
MDEMADLKSCLIQSLIEYECFVNGNTLEGNIYKYWHDAGFHRRINTQVAYIMASLKITYNGHKK